MEHPAAMPSIVSRLLQWDAGHRVLGHEGHCKHLHGHRYTAEVVVLAPELDSLGRVVDFGVLKSVVGKWVQDNWDHNFLCNPQDPLHTLYVRGVNGPLDVFAGKQPYFMKYGNPTAENIARELHDKAVELLPPELQVLKVRVWETPNCYADYLPDSVAYTPSSHYLVS